MQLGLEHSRWTDTPCRLSTSSELKKPLSLGATDSLKLLITTLEGTTAKRPHQAFLTLRDPHTKLQESFPFSVKESGKAKLELVRLLSSTSQFQTA